MMLERLGDFFNNKKVLILGFGLEGQSTLALLQKLGCSREIAIADQNRSIKAADTQYPLFCGDGYLSSLEKNFDVIMKAPGVALFDRVSEDVKGKITSQTDLFLRFCDNRTIGITGTKGKSTTASLIYQILTQCGKNAKLIGNIGVPPFEAVYGMGDDIIVMELSCHQLEYVKASPDIAVLLNIYEEHLDHYVDFEHYKAAKENIFKYQGKGGILIRGDDGDLAVYRSMINPDSAKLRGEHNYNNMAVAVKAAVLLGCGESDAVIAAEKFGGLEHRLEFFTEINGVKYVNDSISTIPAAAIAAVKAFPETDTLIIGGMDRGIDYSALIEFLGSSDCRVENVILLPDSGHKIADALLAAGVSVHKSDDMAGAVSYAKTVSKRCCVLSPAAASYGFYKNFEERGKHFKGLVLDGKAE